MKRNFTNENFEYFLRQSADGLRMRPDERVWKGISNNIDKRKRRIAFFFAAILLIGTGISYPLINTTNKATKLGSGTVTTYGDQHLPVLPDKANSKLAVINFKDLHPPMVKRVVSPIDHLLNTTESYASTEANEQDLVNNNFHPETFSPSVVDSYIDEDFSFNTKKEFESNTKDITYPLSIENVVNSFHKSRNLKTGVQFYFTPTVSYRKLQEQKTIIRSAVPLGISSYQTSMYNINNAVTQKPDIGFELGLAVKHTLGKNLKLRGGLQFNVNRYDIRVFNSPNQLSTIRLNVDNSTNYLNTVTNYSNFTGSHTDWLQNFYFQLSAPVGLELKLKGDDNLQFGIASTIQPTYILGERAYAISSDYKTYAEVPGLIRHTNINTSFETFVSYSTKKYTWQVGPQVRYQLLSSFVKTYSVKEHLLDFGLKIGISPIK